MVELYSVLHLTLVADSDSVTGFDDWTIAFLYESSRGDDSPVHVILQQFLLNRLRFVESLHCNVDYQGFPFWDLV